MTIRRYASRILATAAALTMSAGTLIACSSQPATENSAKVTTEETVQEYSEPGTATADENADSSTVVWGYEGEGTPESWGELHSDFETCSTGKAQSPIDITASAAADLPDVDFSYANSPAEILNNGHTIQLTPIQEHTATLGGVALTLSQMHLHTPAEHLAKGEHHAGEAHFVHTDENDNITVVGVLLDEGETNPVLDTMIAYAPTEVDATTTVNEPINIDGLLPDNREYITYMGSLTTPPCTENVTWLVYTQPVMASPEQIAQLTQLMGENNRPVQDLNDRELQVDNTL